jgi:hypothetical protein
VSTGEKYYTYRLKGVPLDRENRSFFIFWLSENYDNDQELEVSNNTYSAREFDWWSSDDDGQELKKSNIEKEFKFFNFSIYEKGYLKDKPLAGLERYINTEPYTFRVNFNINDSKKIIVNKLIFRSKNKVIDLREIIEISYMEKNSPYYYDFSEEEIIDFRKFGIIDVNNLNNERRIIEKITFNYDNVDVIFNKDKYFIMECDITFEGDVEGYETENYSFSARFNRLKYTEEKMSLLTFLIYKMIISKI